LWRIDVKRRGEGRRRSFWEVTRDGDSSLEALWLAFWEGHFEYHRQGKIRTQLRIEAGFNHDASVTREFMTRILGDGGPRLRKGVGAAKSRTELWSLLASAPYDDVDVNFLRTNFEQVTIPGQVLATWKKAKERRPDDRIGKRIKRLLAEAERELTMNPDLTHEQIALKLAPNDQRRHGYKTDTIRRILDGRYRPAHDRGIEGLRKRWRRAKRKSIPFSHKASPSI